MAVSFYIPTRDVQGFQLLHIIANICYFLGFYLFIIFNISYANGCAVAAHCASERDIYISRLLRVIPIILEASGR